MGRGRCCREYFLSLLLSVTSHYPSRERGCRTAGVLGVSPFRPWRLEAFAVGEKEILRRMLTNVNGCRHSTGRGGIANITEQEEPAVERPSVSLREGEYRSAGRGGSGNLVRN